MEIINALILGAIQGITEFLPVSSSAHLIIVSWLQNGAVLSITMNVAFHMGTLAAVLIYFRDDWLKLIFGAVGLALPSQRKATYQQDKSLLLNLFIGSLPAGIVGLLYKDEISEIFHRPEMTLIPLALVGVLMWLFDRVCPVNRKIGELSIFQALIIGIFQACALIPGTSRSGSTIMGGRLFGLDRVSAARFSFLLGTPAMLGAAVLEMKHLSQIEFSSAFILGIASSTIVGIFSIKFLLNFLNRFGFVAFMAYRCALALFIYFYL